MMNSKPAERPPANLFLRSLSHRDAALLRPMLIPVHCREGECLSYALSRRPLVYFPETMVVSLGVGATQTSVGVVGFEGLIGWAALIAGQDSGMTARVILNGGDAFAISAPRLQTACVVSPSLATNVLRFVQAFSLQMAASLHSAVCDSLDTRLCAWLLMLHDRSAGDELCLTHGALGGLLQVRRASITDALHRLEGRRAVRCTRNCVRVHDRAMLEHLAGGSYGAAEHAYGSSIGPFGKTVRAAAPEPQRLAPLDRAKVAQAHSMVEAEATPDYR